MDVAGGWQVPATIPRSKRGSSHTHHGRSISLRQRGVGSQYRNLDRPHSEGSRCHDMCGPIQGGDNVGVHAIACGRIQSDGGATGCQTFGGERVRRSMVVQSIVPHTCQTFEQGSEGDLWSDGNRGRSGSRLLSVKCKNSTPMATVRHIMGTMR